MAIATMGRGTFKISSTEAEGVDFVLFEILSVRIAQERYHLFRLPSITNSYAHIPPMIFYQLMGGSLADRIGQKKVLLLGLFGLVLLLPLIVIVKNVVLATLPLVPIGLVLFGTYSPAIVMGQNYLPNHVGLSSGITLGVAVSIGGGAAPIIGRMADIYGIWFPFVLIAILPVFFWLVALSLPTPQGEGD